MVRLSVIALLILIFAMFSFQNAYRLVFIKQRVAFQFKLFSQSRPLALQRIERILANRGVGSRTDVLSLIKKGKISVKGKIIRSGADRFPLNVAIEVNGKCSEAPPLITVYNKPIGVHSTLGDPMNRTNLLPLKDTYSFLSVMHPVGRLDADTSGLLLFCSDGLLTTNLLNPLHAVEREYEAIVTGLVEHNVLQIKLANGVKTTDGVFAGTLLASTPFPAYEDSQYLQGWLRQYSTQSRGICDVYREQCKRHQPTTTSATIAPDVATVDLTTSEKMEHLPYSYVRLSVAEGKYRMVRRMLHNAGHSVCFLHRRRYGQICLTSIPPPPVTSSQSKAEAIWPPRNEEVLGSVRLCTAAELDSVTPLLNIKPTG